MPEISNASPLPDIQTAEDDQWEIELPLELLRELGRHRIQAYMDIFQSRWVGGTGSKLQVSEFQTEYLLAILSWDKELRLKLLSGLGDIEIRLRALVANSLERRSERAHIDSSNFHPKFSSIGNESNQSNYAEWCKAISRKIESGVRSEDQQMSNFSEMRIAQVLEYTDFGAITRLVRGMRHEDRVALAGEFGAIDPKQFDNWLSVFNYVRNLSAHHERLWARPLIVNPSLRGFDAPAAISLDPKNGSFLIASACAIAIHSLMRSPWSTQSAIELGDTLSSLPVWVPQVSNHQIGLAIK